MTVATLGGQPETHILGETFYNQAPVRFGDFIAKIPVVEFFQEERWCVEVRAQLCTDLELMPTENAAVIWPEDRSPYRPIAPIRVAPQTAWSDARSRPVDDGMQFSLWHGLADHRPLGGIMSARKQVYEMAKKYRAERNGLVIEEPREKVVFSDWAG